MQDAFAVVVAFLIGLISLAHNDFASNTGEPQTLKNDVLQSVFPSNHDGQDLGSNLRGIIKEHVEQSLERIEQTLESHDLPEPAQSGDAIPDSGCVTDHDSGDDWTRTTIRCLHQQVNESGSGTSSSSISITSSTSSSTSSSNGP